MNNCTVMLALYIFKDEPNRGLNPLILNFGS